MQRRRRVSEAKKKKKGFGSREAEGFSGVSGAIYGVSF